MIIQFVRKGNLDQHSLTHTREKQYQCDISRCEKKFSQKGHLDQHSLIHTGEKAYKCQQCDKAFARADKLSAHVRAVHLVEKQRTDKTHKNTHLLNQTSSINIGNVQYIDEH